MIKSRLYLSTMVIQKMMMLVLGKENAVLLCFAGWQSKSGTFVRFHGTWPFSAIGDAANRKQLATHFSLPLIFFNLQQKANLEQFTGHHKISRSSENPKEFLISSYKEMIDHQSCGQSLNKIWFTGLNLGRRGGAGELKRDGADGFIVVKSWRSSKRLKCHRICDRPFRRSTPKQRAPLPSSLALF